MGEGRGREGGGRERERERGGRGERQGGRREREGGEREGGREGRRNGGRERENDEDNFRGTHLHFVGQMGLDENVESGCVTLSDLEGNVTCTMQKLIKFMFACRPVIGQQTVYMIHFGYLNCLNACGKTWASTRVISATYF